MKNGHFKWISAGFLGVFLLGNSYIYSQQGYTSGQAVFVQPSYNSSLYTEYRYNPNQGVPNRLPAYTTNQAVFVQQPYATVPQTYTSYPTAGQYNLPYTESRFSTPTNYPSTVNQAYPFATVRSYTSSPYSTTTQYPSSNYPYTSPTYTRTETYPYTSLRAAVPTSPTPNTPPSNAVYNAYPANTFNSTTYTYPSTVYPNTSIYPSTTYPTTNLETPYPLSSALPETIVKPVPVPVPPPSSNTGPYYNPNRMNQ